MFLLLFRQFLRTPACRLGLTLGLLLGLVSLFIGKDFLDKQERSALQVANKQSEHIDRNIEYHSEDLGLLMYYLKFSLINEQRPLAGLSIGQKDLNPSVQSVNILTLEGQRYDTDLVNPAQLLFGNLDLGFVIIYVFPLLIIAFTYNLRSEEEEGGTWRMISVMSRSNLKFLLLKLLVRFSVLMLLLIVLFLLASIILGISFGDLIFTFFVVSVLYQVFWFSLCLWITTLKRPSNFNALVLLTCWLGLVLLIPAMVNGGISSRYPVPEAFTTFIKQRDGYHTKWDLNKQGTMDKFYSSYPELKKYGYPTENGFTWHWYYAMQHLGDEESRKESAAMLDKILQREKVSKQLARFIPSMHTQLLFNDLAGTSLVDHLSFLARIKTFHEETRLYFYPKIFENEVAIDVDWDQFKPVTHENEIKSFDWLDETVPLLVGSFLFLGMWGLSIRRFS